MTPKAPTLADLRATRDTLTALSEAASSDALGAELWCAAMEVGRMAREEEIAERLRGEQRRWVKQMRGLRKGRG